MEYGASRDITFNLTAFQLHAEKSKMAASVVLRIVSLYQMITTHYVTV